MVFLLLAYMEPRYGEERVQIERRGLDEVRFLKRLEQIIEAGESQADVLLRLYDSEWERSIDPVYKYMAF